MQKSAGEDPLQPKQEFLSKKKRRPPRRSEKLCDHDLVGCGRQDGKFTSWMCFWNYVKIRDCEKNVVTLSRYASKV